MATETRSHTYTASFHWGAILAGSFVGLGSWVMLYALGAAIGAGTEALPGQVSTWTAIYSLVAPILAFFVGGYIAGRGERVKSRGDAAMNGLVVWGFCALLGSLSIGGVAGLLANAPDVPVVYAWAVFGSFFLSLIGAVLGAVVGWQQAREELPALPGRVESSERSRVYP
ncbi:MAG: hypothetical protein WBV82_16800 [Myxococcaceae bacterium]